MKYESEVHDDSERTFPTGIPPLIPPPLRITKLMFKSSATASAKKLPKLVSLLRT